MHLFANFLLFSSNSVFVPFTVYLQYAASFDDPWIFWLACVVFIFFRRFVLKLNTMMMMMMMMLMMMMMMMMMLFANVIAALLTIDIGLPGINNN